MIMWSLDNWPDICRPKLDSLRLRLNIATTILFNDFHVSYIHELKIYLY